MRKSPAALILTVVVAAGALAAAQQTENPTFRTKTDLIAVDVQVVDGKGLPILGLGAEKFEVTVSGRLRRVVSAEFVRFDDYKTLGRSTPPQTVVTTAPTSAPNATGRTFMLAIDARSFAAGYEKGVLEAARLFIGGLQATDRIGLFAYPKGPQMAPTRDHAAIIARLSEITGQRVVPYTKYNLRPTHIVAISRKIEGMAVIDGYQLMQLNPELKDMLTTLCPTNGPDNQLECIKMVSHDVVTLANHLEDEASQSIAALRALLEDLARIEGRKVLVLLSGGLIAADQSGGRPDVGNLDVVMAQDAAKSNTAIYTLYVDWKFLERFMAANVGFPPMIERLSRDSLLNSTWLGEFSREAGGKLFTISAGDGNGAFDRILSETSAHYLLGVVPELADRDGRPHPLVVKVKQRGATVRARTWVALPKELPPSPDDEPVVVVSSPTPVSSAPVASAPATATLPVVVTAPAAAAPVLTTAPAPVVSSNTGATPLRAGTPPVMSPALRSLLTATGEYVARFETVFSDLVAEERYLQVVGADQELAPSVNRRELVSDFLLVVPPGSSMMVPFRDVFEVNGAPIRDRQDRLTKLFAVPNAASVAQANAILEQSSTYNIGVDRTVNLPVVGLEVFRASSQSRFRFRGGGIDPASPRRAYVVEFDEFTLPAMISGAGGRDLLMRGQAWIDAANGAILRTEIHIDDTTVLVTMVTRYEFNPAFNVAVPVSLSEDIREQNGRHTIGTATYGRFRKFGVETNEIIPVPR